MVQLSRRVAHSLKFISNGGRLHSRVKEDWQRTAQKPPTKLRHVDFQDWVDSRTSTGISAYNAG